MPFHYRSSALYIIAHDNISEQLSVTAPHANYLTQGAQS